MSDSAPPSAQLQLAATIPIFVLRFSLGEFQHGVLAVARSAGRAGIPVYVVRREPREPAIRSRYIAAGFDIPSESSDEARLEAVMAVGERIGRSLLLAVDDKAAVFVDEHAPALSERFVFPRQPSGLTQRLASKRALWELCHAHGIPAPACEFPSTEQELIEQAADFGYPTVLKRSDPWLPTRDPRAPSVWIARDRDELIAAYRRMESPVRPQVLLQEYIPGGSDSVWMFNGYFDENSTCLCSFTGRKLRQYRPGIGPTSLGVSARNSEVAELAQRLMEGLGYHGIVDMGFRHDRRDGSYKLLDVNPRIGSTFRLFVGERELDVLRAQYLDLTGQPVPAAREIEGRKWIAEPADLASAAELARDHQLRFGSWARSLRGIDEAAWWAADDPLPFLAMSARLTRSAASLLRRRNRASL